jgi:hypothetical protein
MPRGALTLGGGIPSNELGGIGYDENEHQDNGTPQDYPPLTSTW